ncbi:MAG: glycoside hydrolase family 73 protein [Limosilactobacillus sp.]|uniref:glycoside hydrolase family 73 protein n=1 Tax=Limosilactobacillus sp. TaxID=2773925 RepID=UPI0026FFAC6C|nr:glycoside hydrolase family 73 protein [Limosilactobacillus sp.]
MAKRRRRSGKKNTVTKLLISFLAIIALFLGVYFGHHYYRIWNQQRLEAQLKRQDQEAKEEFIKQVAPEAQAMQNSYHVFASITIAQAILESQWGNSQLASQYHNLFGIKGDDPETSRVLATKEYINGQWIVIKGRFRVYDSWSDSIKDHTQLMLNGTDTNNDNYQNVIQAKNYRQAAYALQESGYATDPNYAKKLITVIKAHKLYNYDK